MGHLHIPRNIWLCMVEFCRTLAGHGIEACGVLAGSVADEDRVTELYPLENVAEHPRTQFQFDPQQQIDLWNLLDERDMVARVIYHAHLVGGAELSARDRQFALDPTIRHLVYAVTTEHTALWRVVSGRVEQAGYMITGLS